MGQYTKPAKVKLIVGIIGKNPGIVQKTRNLLREEYGTEEETMACIPFTWTDYYAGEVGPDPVRCFVSFEELIQREAIVGIKRTTNKLEDSLRQQGKRPANIDPGYLTLGQFFLVSTKDQRQRVYLGKGIFAEPSLFFKNGKFHPFEWTYWDYRSEDYHVFFMSARSKLAYQLRHGRPYSRRNDP
ncbi:DUF4416 family protein [Fibrobacterota bacterium]